MNEVAAVNSSGTNNLTSVEIAELTGKQHKHVMADAVKMLKALELDSAEFSAQYKDSTGRRLPCFSLPPREVKILITGYDVVRRAKVIDRLEQLGIPPAQFSAGYTESALQNSSDAARRKIKREPRRRMNSPERIRAQDRGQQSQE